DGERFAPCVRRPHELATAPDGRHELRRLVVRRQVRDLTTVDVTEIEVVVAAHPAELCGDDLPAVGRARGDQAVPAELEGPRDAGLEVARDDVEVDTVAAIRRQGQRAAGGVRR